MKNINEIEAFHIYELFDNNGNHYNRIHIPLILYKKDSATWGFSSSTNNRKTMIYRNEYSDSKFNKNKIVLFKELSPEDIDSNLLYFTIMFSIIP